MKIILLTLWIIFGCGVAAAQDAAGEADMAATYEMLRGFMSVERETMIAEELRLSEEERDRFWPLYDEYRVEIEEIQDRYEGTSLSDVARSQPIAVTRRHAPLRASQALVGVGTRIPNGFAAGDRSAETIPLNLDWREVQLHPHIGGLEGQAAQIAVARELLDDSYNVGGAPGELQVVGRRTRLRKTGAVGDHDVRAVLRHLDDPGLGEDVFEVPSVKIRQRGIEAYPQG